VKIIAESAPQKDRMNLAQVNSREGSGQSLEVMGFSQDGEVLFQYVNEEQGVQ
jgi:hypothetical protein